MTRLRKACCLAALIVLAGGCSTGTPTEQSTTAPPATAPQAGASLPAPSPPSASPAIPTRTGSSGLPLAAIPAPAAPLPRQRTAEELIRAEVASWRDTPYRDNGTSRGGIGNAGFVRAVYRSSFDADIPASYDQQIRTGKLVARDALVTGDLVFFEGRGLGPFRAKSVGIFIGADQIAIADKDEGVTIARLSESRWGDRFKTARRMPVDPNAATPAFDTASYGSTSDLLRDVAEAWSGTLYKQGGATFDGIGNEEFVRSIFEAIYDTELEGGPSQWATMGKAVSRADLQAGDIVLYEAAGIGQLIKQRHAGLYISDGEFVHAVRGLAVTISALTDSRWSKAFVAARRVDPDALARAAERRQQPAPSAAAGVESVSEAPGAGARSGPVADMTDHERQLRAATEPWKGTPYRLGGTTKAGVDCSAFVRAMYDDVYGVALPRTAEEQERLGARVDRKDLASGDLVFFRTQGMGPFFKSRHVGIYLGGGEFAQASGRLGVNVSRLDSSYWSRKYQGARRLPKGV